MMSALDKMLQYYSILVSDEFRPAPSKMLSNTVFLRVKPYHFLSEMTNLYRSSRDYLPRPRLDKIIDKTTDGQTNKIMTAMMMVT